jgi:hypothetical protein
MADASINTNTTNAININSNKEEENTFNSTQALLFFLICTISYFIARSIFGSNILLSIIYYLVVIVGQYFINLSITKKICGKNQYINVAKFTIIPWVVIFGLLNGMLYFFPGWLIPFSNTIGYFVVKILGINRLLNNLFVTKIDNMENKDMKVAAEALNHIYNDKSLLINEISSKNENFENFWNTMKNSGLFKPSLDQDLKNLESMKSKLLFFVNLKDVISEGLWYILTGMLITTISYNYIINSSCERSISDIEENMKDQGQQ